MLYVLTAFTDHVCLLHVFLIKVEKLKDFCEEKTELRTKGSGER